MTGSSPVSHLYPPPPPYNMLDRPAGTPGWLSAVLARFWSTTSSAKKPSEGDQAEREGLLLPNDEEAGVLETPSGRHPNPRQSSRRRTLLCWIGGASVFAVYICVVQLLWHKHMSATRWPPHVRSLIDIDNATTSLIACHSHNDEMQGPTHALSLALSLHLGSVEVDTWLVGGELLVGHQEGDLIHGWKMKELYLDPLMEVLDRNNEGRSFAEGERRVGVWADDPEAGLQLVIDMKVDGTGIFTALLALLEPFLSKSYLTTYSPSTRTWSPGPLLIIGTGDTPLPLVVSPPPPSPDRLIFYDAPLLSLSQNFTLPENNKDGDSYAWTPEIAPLASAMLPLAANLGLLLPPSENSLVVKSLREYTAEAERRGIKSRWWGFVDQPGSGVRRRMWEMLRLGGVDWFNADELEECASWVREGGG